MSAPNCANKISKLYSESTRFLQRRPITENHFVIVVKRKSMATYTEPGARNEQPARPEDPLHYPYNGRNSRFHIPTFTKKALLTHLLNIWLGGVCTAQECTPNKLSTSSAPLYGMATDCAFASLSARRNLIGTQHCCPPEYVLLQIDHMQGTLCCRLDLTAWRIDCRYTT